MGLSRPSPDDGAFPVNARSEPPTRADSGYERGQRLFCEVCRSEIEVLNPTTAEPVAQVFRCCGQPMTPSVGVAVQVNVEG